MRTGVPGLSCGSIDASRVPLIASPAEALAAHRNNKPKAKFFIALSMITSGNTAACLGFAPGAAWDVGRSARDPAGFAVEKRDILVDWRLVAIEARAVFEDK